MPKRIYSNARWMAREIFWKPIKLALQNYIKSHGPNSASRIAHAIGVNASQIHRFSCPICEHNQIPDFPTGMALALFLKGIERKAIEADHDDNNLKAELAKSKQSKDFWKAYRQKNGHRYPINHPKHKPRKTKVHPKKDAIPYSVLERKLRGKSRA